MVKRLPKRTVDDGASSPGANTSYLRLRDGTLVECGETAFLATRFAIRRQKAFAERSSGGFCSSASPAPVVLDADTAVLDWRIAAAGPVIGALAGLGPVWHTSKIEPIAALRS